MATRPASFMATSSLGAVEAQDVVPEDAVLGFVGQLVALQQLLDLVLGPLDVRLVREIGGEEQGAVPDALDRSGQRSLAALAAEVDLSRGDVLARPALEPLRELAVLRRRPH